MDMGTGMGVIFENGYGCGYSLTRPKPATLPFLDGRGWVNKVRSGYEMDRFSLINLGR